MVVPFKTSKLSLGTGDAIMRIFILTVRHIHKSFFKTGGAMLLLQNTISCIYANLPIKKILG
tara:strand:- start:102 stop:287 length:186 start_codon:yes stop_codon:yes gene_type:complete